jgi:hypothetical protein
LPIRVDHARQHHLDGDVALQPSVARAVYLAHSPGADLTGNFVRTEM